MVDRMDGTYLSTANREGLLQWLDGLPAPRYRTDRDSPQVLLGETLFAETGCDSCHIPQGAPLQDLFDVGTGGAFVVPSLRGVGARAPFLHDGCAATLEERFLCGGDQHGEVDDLTEEDLQALIAYLQTL